MFLGHWVNVFGPEILSTRHWFGTALWVFLAVAGILLVVGFGYLRLEWHDDRTAPVLTALIVVGALFGVFIAVEADVETTRYAHRLSCGAVLGRIMITDGVRAGDPGRFAFLRAGSV
jgi:hypothetical protein